MVLHQKQEVNQRDPAKDILGISQASLQEVSRLK